MVRLQNRLVTRLLFVFAVVTHVNVPFCMASARELRFLSFSPPVPKRDTCWFCDGENFFGGFGCLERGIGYYSDLTGSNGHNDRYESIVCGPDVNAQVFAAVGFRGSNTMIVGSEPSLRASGWSNRISSILVRPNPDDRIIVAEDGGSYRGRPYLKRLTFVPFGNYAFGELQALGLLQDGRQIIEIIVPKRASVTLVSYMRSLTSKTIGPGSSDLRNLTLQDLNGETITWAEGLEALQVRQSTGSM